MDCVVQEWDTRASTNGDAVRHARERRGLPGCVPSAVRAHDAACACKDVNPPPARRSAPVHDDGGSKTYGRKNKSNVDACCMHSSRLGVAQSLKSTIDSRDALMAPLLIPD